MPDNDEDQQPYLSASEKQDKRFGSKKDSEAVVSPDQIKQGEESGDTPKNSSSPEAKEAAMLGDSGATTPNDQVGNGHVADDGASRMRIRWSNRKAAGGGIIGLIIASIIGMFAFLQGPLQMVHLSQILGKGLLPNSTSANNRIPKLYKYMGIRNTAETRLSITGRAVYRNTLTKLATKGIDVTPSARGFSDMKIDINKLYPDLADSSPIQKRTEAAKRIGIDPKKFPPDTIAGTSSSYSFNGIDLDVTETKNVARTVSGVLDEGRLATGIRSRQWFKAHNIPTLFHPFRALENAIDRKAEIAFKAQKQKLEERKKNRAKSKYTKLAENARNELKAAANSNLGKAVSAVSVGLDVACTLYNIADAVPLVNYGNIVVPAMVEALETTGSGNQIQAGGPDVTMAEIGAQTAALTDENGKSIWEGKALNALANGSAGEGEDLDDGYRQAFSPQTTEAMIEDYIGGAIGGAVGKTASIACSPAGQIANIVVGVGLTVFSGGGWTAGKVASAATKAALISSLVARFSSGAIDYLSEDPARAFSGPVGGNLLAYGMRATNNSLARMGGGVELSSDDETAIMHEINQQEKDDFQHKSYFARVFDASDYRSLAANVIRSTPDSLQATQSNIASAMSLNPLSIFSSVFSGLTPKVAAADTYNYGFSLYGIPASVMNDPSLEDPFDNAEQAASQGLLEKYKDKAHKCFGVNISIGPQGWDAVSQEDPNPADKSYATAGCDDLSDPGWKRVMMFVNDTQLMASLACFEGDATSCQQMGFGGAQTTTAPSKAVNGNIYVLGDSLSEGMRDAGSLASSLQQRGWNPTIMAECGRHLASNGDNCSGQPVKGGLQQVDQAADQTAIKNAGVVLIGLGTNDPGSQSFGVNVQALVSKVQALNPSAKIYWVNLFSTDGKIGQYQAMNKTLSSISGQSGFTVLDWASKAPQVNAYPPNSYHPSNYQAMADFVVSQLGNAP